FEQYFEHGNADIKETLTYQYRMHKDIMDIVNLFYDGYLQDGNEGKYGDGRKSHNLFIHSTSGTAMIVPDRHAYWIDSSTLDGEPIYEQRKPGSTSAENILEAYAIIELLKKMEIEYANQINGLPPVSVGVISFYYDQVSMLRNLVKKESFHAIDVEINTVDRFQGKEKEIIIVSLVRNVKNAKHNTDSHIAAFQRINVAFSRAQNLLIIVGAKDMYAPQPVVMTDMNNGEEKTVMVYKNIIEMMDMKGTLFSCDEIIPENLVGQIFEKLNKKGDAEA
ncbi:MAG: C-terminal helicase domain-containing protein, partial [Acetatifactor sp.]|nr:C-terminal helicase domain-containing protein [Acetatifactor sp.]